MDILLEWFRQDLSLEVAIVNAIFIGVGIMLGVRNGSIKREKTLIIACLCICILSVVIGNEHSYASGILAVFASGISLLLLVGVILGVGIKKLIK